MPPRPSPNAATPVCEAGRLTRPGRAAAPIEVGTAAWFRWLAAPGTTTFYVRAPAGAYTARREQRRGGHFWYAYAKRGPKLRKAYLGRPAALTWERVLEIAHTLHPLAPVLTAKLGPPPPPASAVPRPRLLARLAPPRLRALTVITAPPGYGKTTLLSQWAAALAAQPGAPPVAWLALDAEDNDPARFWALLAAAVAQAFPAAASPAQSVLAGPAPSGPAVINALFTAVPAAPLCLVLDDYHVLTAPEIHAALAFALEHLPARWHLLLTSRTEPTGLPLPRLRAQGRLAELTATDLRLTPAEAAQFLRQALGRPITPALAAALDEHTQGWAAALQLAALALAEDAGRADFPPEAQRHLFDYLAAEVLDRQPPAVQRFLTHTSLLERLSAELCAALVPDAPPDLLAGLAARQIFLTPLDAERRWYRCHPLFAEFLRARLPDAERPALHTRAAEWLAAHGDLGAAFDHALAAGNVDLAADLLDRAAEALMAEGAVATLARRVAALPPAQVQARPSLAIWQAWCAVLTGQPAVVEPSQILHARQIINDIYIDDKVKDYIVDLVCATRDPEAHKIDVKEFIQLGASPRATINLTLAAKAYAFLKGRGYVTPQDVKSIGMDVLRHRVAITYEAEAEEKTSETIIQKIFDELPVP